MTYRRIALMFGCSAGASERMAVALRAATTPEVCPRARVPHDGRDASGIRPRGDSGAEVYEGNQTRLAKRSRRRRHADRRPGGIFARIQTQTLREPEMLAV